jgi:hypothetical protein
MRGWWMRDADMRWVIQNQGFGRRRDAVILGLLYSERLNLELLFFDRITGPIYINNPL